MLSVAWEPETVPRKPRNDGASDRPYPNVAKALSDLRKLAKLTQEEMAHAVGLTLSGYRTYEQGKRNLSQDQIPLYARALRVPIEELARRLWPAEYDRIELVETQYSTDWEEIQRQVDRFPPAQRERILRGFAASIEIANGSDLARQN